MNSKNGQTDRKVLSQYGYRAANKPIAPSFTRILRTIHTVNRAKQMVTNYRPVNFIEFYDVDITNSNPVNIPPPSSPINDAPDGVASGGYLYVPLTDAHQNLPGPGG